MALHHRPDHWRDKSKIRVEMEFEAVNSTQIDAVIAKVVAETHLIHLHLEGKVQWNGGQCHKDAARSLPARDQIDALKLHPAQLLVETHIQKSIDMAFQLLEGEDVDTDSRRALAALGPPGCGKTFVTKRCISYALEQGGSVLLALPTGQMASRMREVTLFIGVKTNPTRPNR